MIFSILTSILDLNFRTIMLIAVIYSILSSYFLYKYGLLDTKSYGMFLVGFVLLDLGYSLYKNYYAQPMYNNLEGQEEKYKNQMPNASQLCDAPPRPPYHNAQLNSPGTSNLTEVTDATKTHIAQRSPLVPEITSIKIENEKMENNAAINMENPTTTNNQLVNKEYYCDDNLCYRRAIDVKGVNNSKKVEIAEVSEGDGEGAAEMLEKQVKCGIDITNEDSLMDNQEDVVLWRENYNSKKHLEDMDRQRPGMGIKILDTEDEGYQNILSNLRIEVREI